MAIKVADNFSYLGAKPLDARLQFATVNEMVASPVATLYDGCFAYVKGTKKYYSFDSTNDVDVTLGKWREYSSGSGSDSSVVEGYLNPTNGKFYEESTYTTEITGEAEKIYVALDTDLIYRHDFTNGFVLLSESTDGTIEGYLNPTDGKFYEESTYTTEITGEAGKLYVTLDTNKVYRYDSTNGFVLVGGGDGETIQYDTMPTASSELVGTIVQYVGSTTVTYTKGYWYECVLDGATYKWQNIQVQEGGGESGSGISVTATLLAASWDAQNQQTVTFTGYKASMNGVIGVPASATDAQKEAYASALVRTVAQNGNQFTFECEGIPSIDLPVTIYAGGSSGSGTGGHTIIDNAGQDMTAREGLQFIGATVTDDSAGNKTVVTIPAIQYSTMPTVDAEHLGKIIQYIGADTATLTSGFFYKCVSDGAATPTYSWERTNAQPMTALTIKDSGTAVTERSTVNFTDFDIEDDSTNEETDIAPHRLTQAELTDIVTPLPSVPLDMPVLFDETGAEYVVAWYKLANGKKKPIYRKDVTLHNQSYSTGTPILFDFSTLNVDKLFYTGGSVTRYVQSTGNWQFIMLNSPATNSNYIVALYVDGTNIKGDFGSAIYSQITDVYLQIEYTKLTDTPID